jgi:hypothetical protein
MRKSLLPGLTALMAFFLVLQACTKNTAVSPSYLSLDPVATSTPSMTPFSTPDPMGAPVGITCFAFVGKGGYDGAGSAAVYLSVNGLAETTAGITITTPSGDVPMTFMYGPGSNMFMVGNSVVYQPGGAYTLNITTSIGNASATVTAPNGTLSLASDGSGATWTEEGNHDYAYVTDESAPVTLPGLWTYNSQSFTSDLASPLVFPVSAFPNSGVYEIEVSNENHTLMLWAPLPPRL